MNTFKEAYKELDAPMQMCISELALNPGILPMLANVNEQLIRQHLQLHSIEDPNELSRHVARLSAWMEFAEDLQDMLMEVAQNRNIAQE